MEARVQPKTSTGITDLLLLRASCFRRLEVLEKLP